jgi:hypothetical protein
MPDTKRGLKFLQRAGLVQTYVNPASKIEPRALLIHNLELAAPLPLPALLYHLNGEYQAPDRGQTLEWPHV